MCSADVLQQLEKRHREDYQQLQQRHQLRPLRCAKLALEEPRVVQAAADLKSGKLGIMNFLKVASCTVQALALKPPSEPAQASVQKVQKGEEESDTES